MNSKTKKQTYISPKTTWIEIETSQSVMAASNESGHTVSGTGTENGWAGAPRREARTPRSFWESGNPGLAE